LNFGHLPILVRIVSEAAAGGGARCAKSGAGCSGTRIGVDSRLLRKPVASLAVQAGEIRDALDAVIRGV
jgi:hypothetical protein